MSRVSPTRRSLLKSLAAAGLLATGGIAARDLTGGGARAAAQGLSEADVVELLTPPSGWDYPVADLPLPFGHGVASGDPLADRVILWTRVTVPVPPDGLRVPVAWRVARDPALEQVVATGSVTTDASRDFTVKVDASGLDPATTYYYGFSALGRDSLVGRTRTAPAGDVDDLRIAVVACSSWWSGYFNAYRQLAAMEDLDLVVHCGDYIYDFPDAEELVRARRGIFDEEYVDFRPWRTQEEHRRRFALYCAEPDFLALRQQVPISVTWDNHDFNVTDVEDGITAAESRAAFWEWVPARPPKGDASGRFPAPVPGLVEPEDDELVYRNLGYGSMAEILLIDAHYIGPTARPEDEHPFLTTPQFTWLTETMAHSANRGVRWRLVVNQGPMSQLRFGPIPFEDDFPYPQEVTDAFAFSTDDWDGYPQERIDFFTFLRDNGVANNLVATGDTHGNFCWDLTEDNSPGNYEPATGGGLNPSVGVEFLATSVSRGGADETVEGIYYQNRYGEGPPYDRSRFEGAEVQAAGLAGSRAIEAGLMSANPNMRYVEWTEHGFGLVHLTADEALLEFWWAPILEPSDELRLGQQIRVASGSNHAERVLSATASSGASRGPLAPPPDRAAFRAEFSRRPLPRYRTSYGLRNPSATGGT